MGEPGAPVMYSCKLDQVELPVPAVVADPEVGAPSMMSGEAGVVALGEGF